MKKCPSCGRAYSDLVQTCPICGIDMAAEDTHQAVKAAANHNGSHTGQNTRSDSRHARNAAKKATAKRINPLYWVAYIVTAALVGALVSSLGVSGIAIIAGSVIMGAILGLIPFLAARSRGKQKLSRIAMAVTVVCSILKGIYLSIPSAVIFTVIALKK